MKCAPVFAAAAVSSAVVSNWVFPDHIDNPNQPTNQHTLQPQMNFTKVWPEVKQQKAI